MTIRREATRVVIQSNGVDGCIVKETGVLAAGAAGVSGNDVPIMSQLPFTREYVSAEQTITAAGLLTLAHGLGAVPKFITAELVCKTADLNYSIGDVVQIHVMQQSSATADNFGLSAKKDATNITVRYGSGATVFILSNATTGAGAGATNTSWRLIVRAWA